MKTQDAIDHFGSKAAVAAAAGLSRSAVSQWGASVPLGTAVLLEKISDGKLKVNVSDYHRPRPRPLTGIAMSPSARRRKRCS